jgi:hypothetical protein
LELLGFLWFYSGLFKWLRGKKIKKTSSVSTRVSGCAAKRLKRDLSPFLGAACMGWRDSDGLKLYQFIPIFASFFRCRRHCKGPFAGYRFGGATWG